MDKQYLNDRLDFLFRHTHACTTFLETQYKTEDEIREFASVTINVGIRQILTKPNRNLTQNLSKNYEAIGEMIVEDFNMLAEWCHQEQQSGLPITLTMPKIELEIMNCMKKLTDKVIREVNQ